VLPVSVSVGRCSIRVIRLLVWSGTFTYRCRHVCTTLVGAFATRQTHFTLSLNPIKSAAWSNRLMTWDTGCNIAGLIDDDQIDDKWLKFDFYLLLHTVKQLTVCQIFTIKHKHTDQTYFNFNLEAIRLHYRLRLLATLRTPLQQTFISCKVSWNVGLQIFLSSDVTRKVAWRGRA